VRVAEFDTLFATSVDRTERIGALRLRVHLTGDEQLEGTVRDLVARESQCCSFFRFTVTPEAPGRLTLDVEVPQQYSHGLDALAARAH
jgi:hypothetical protein